MRMVVVQCSALPTVMVSLLKETVNAVQLNIDQESKLAEMDGRYAIAKEDASKYTMNWTEQVQFNEKNVEWRTLFFEMMSKYGKM